MSSPDISQLTESQQDALQTYTSVTDQDPIAAIPLLQRCDWNVPIAIARFFDGEPASDPLAEAQAAAAVPAPTTRQTTNLQYEALLAANNAQPSRRSNEDLVRRVDTSSSVVPVYRPPFLLSVLLTPLNIVFRVFSTILSPFAFLVPPFLSRVLRNLFTVNAIPNRRQLPPADTARRFIREFEETYTPNPPLPFVESGFNLTLDACKKDGKFLLVVLLSPSHDETNTWVHDTLMSSSFNQFLQSHANEVVLWGGSVQDSEGYQVSTSLNCTKFPFAALICQTTDAAVGSSRPGDMAVVARAAGPTTSSELIAKISAAITSHQSQLTAARAQRAEQQASRSLREEQDSAYERSLAQDRERARLRREEEAAKAEAEKEAQRAADREAELIQKREHWIQWRSQHLPEEPESTVANAVRLSMRMPNGDRVMRRFHADCNIEELYAYVECYKALQQDSPAPTDPPSAYEHTYSFRLVSPMPRAVFDLTSGGTLAATIGRSANIIVEPIDNDPEDEEE